MTGLIDSSEVLLVLQGYNSWWAGKDWKAPEFRRLGFYACQKYLENTELKRAILITGPRRVGKTTILHQLAQTFLEQGYDPKSILYVSLDHPLLKLASLPKILDLYHAQIFPKGKETILLLDEIQYAKDWDLQVKQLVDHHPHYKIVATGSTSLTLRSKTAESGVGRWVTIPVPTLSFYEFTQICGEQPEGVAFNLKPSDLLKFQSPQTDFPNLAAKFDGILPLFHRYLLVGGFPETAKQSNLELAQRLLREDVVERVLKRDMASQFGVRSLDHLEKLFLYICLHSGGIFNTQTCSSELQANQATVTNYLHHLEQAHLIYRVPPISIQGKSLLRARHKVYLVDAALRNAVLLKGEQILNDPNEMGMIVETAVLRHLISYHYRDSPRISYWRDSVTHREVDMIIQSPAYTIPNEVKFRENATLTPNEGIVEFCRQQDIPNAYWVTKRKEDFDIQTIGGLSTRFLRIPAHIFTYLLGQAERLLWVPDKHI